MTSQHRPAPRNFISHSHKDNDFGIQLVRDLRLRLGDDDAVWYDAAGGLSGGHAWWRKIMEELRAGDQIIIGTSILRFEQPEPAGQSDQSAIPRLAVDCPDYRCHFIVPLRDATLSIRPPRTPSAGSMSSRREIRGWSTILASM